MDQAGPQVEKWVAEVAEFTPLRWADGSREVRFKDISERVRSARVWLEGAGPGTAVAEFSIGSSVAPGDAERWARAHQRVPAAGLDLPTATGQVIDVSAVPSDTEQAGRRHVIARATVKSARQLRVAASAASALVSGWQGRGQGAAGLARVLAGEGLAPPPLGSTAEADINSYGHWSWGSSYLPPNLAYMFNVQAVRRSFLDNGPFFSLTHGGHGVNSYALNLVATAGPLAVFVQHPFGGVYNDHKQMVADIGRHYGRLRDILEGAQSGPPRWLLACSFLRHRSTLVPLNPESDEDPSGVDLGSADFFEVATRVLRT